MVRWRPIVVVGSLLATWVGCSGESSRHEPPKSAAGRSGGAGKTSAKGGGAGKLDTAGMTGEGGAAGSENDGGRAASPSGGLSGFAGRSALGGSGAFAGRAANTGGAATGGVATGGVGTGGASGTLGAGGVPATWTCLRSSYGDGPCDCGCGAPDVDCTRLDLAHCDVCNTIGGCNRAECPGRIDFADITRCTPPPTGWTCEAPAYADGTSCDCGCGVKDADCPNTKLSSCDNCRLVGSCTHGACPSSLAPDDNTRCYVPENWECDQFLYGNGSCDCGCGVRDVDCADGSAAACEVCRGCAGFDCKTIDAEDNRFCTTPPGSWTCSQRLYRDGAQCDCGCGAVDPDCESDSRDACDKCDAAGSCSVRACPGFIMTTANAYCMPPEPPPEWICYVAYYGNGSCDCGCGAPDPDCLTSDIGACADCPSCNLVDCQKSIDPADTTQCRAPVSGWVCSGRDYYDYDCDCGCGAPDPACGGVEALYVCQTYPLEGCSGGHRSYIDPSHNELCTTTIPAAWTCDRGYYEDGLCDCGCGAVDPDCASSKASSCRKCDDEGSCSSSACPGTILTNDNAHCSN